MQIGDGWRAVVQFDDFSFGVFVYLIQDFGRAQSRVLQPDGSTIEVTEGEAHSDRIKPTFRLRKEQMQALADGLAENGFVANGRRYSTEMDLVKAHLEDMRRLVFKDGEGVR